MSASSSLRPLSLRKEGDDRLVIEWSDGHRSVFAWTQLRANCPCATCRDERDKPANPFRVLTPAQAAAGPLRPVAVSPVGHYAYKIAWSDGHDTGIYSFEQLRALCQCEQCSQSRKR
jgi:DUF971 family protein